MTGATDARFERRAARRKGRTGDRVAQRQSPQRQKVTYTELDPTVRAPRHGWMLVARKEFADLILSLRFVLLVIVLAAAAAFMINQIASDIRSQAADAASNIPSIFLLLFSAPPANLPISFLWIVGFIGPLLGIVLGFDAVNGERSQGTLPRLLAQPIHRDDVVNGKFVAGLAAIGLALATIIALVSAVGIIQLGITPNPESIIRLFAFWVIAILYIGFWLALAQLFSVVLRSAGASAFAAIVVWVVVSVFGGILASILAGLVAPVSANPSASETVANATLQYQLSELAPTTLFQQASALILDPSQRWAPGSVILTSQVQGALRVSYLSLDQSLLVIWPQIVAMVAITVVVFALAYVAFMRQEVRA